MTLAKDRNDYKILIVEDNPGDSLIITEYLEDEISNPNITNANNYAAAKKKLGEERLDVILLDLTLPDMRGEALVKDISNIIVDIPIIILTGYQDVSFSVRSMSYGIADYLIKDSLNSMILYKSILYSIERNKQLLQIKESNKRYSDLFQFSPQPMWVMDRVNIKFLNVNEAACEHYGYTYEEFMNLSLLDIRPEEDHKHIIDYIELNNDTLPHKAIFRHKKKSGEIILVEVSSKILNKDNPNIRIVLSKDITSEHNAQEDLLDISIKAENRERARIASSLHDGLQQTLLAAYLHVQTFQKYPPQQVDNKHMTRYMDGLSILQESIQQTRSLAHELIPPPLENLGIGGAIQEIIKRYENSGGPVSFDYHDNLEDHSLPENVELLIFRIIQEMINNIIKHSEAQEASIEINLNTQEVKAIILDDGVGFEYDPEENDNRAFGLQSIATKVQSLKGTFTLKSVPGKGTSVKISIPLGSYTKIRKPSNRSNMELPG